MHSDQDDVRAAETTIEHVPVMSAQPALPNAIAQLAHRLTSPGRVVDVLVEPDVQIESVRVGPTVIEPPADGLWSEALASSPRGGENTFVIVVARSTAQEPRVLHASLAVERIAGAATAPVVAAAPAAPPSAPVVEVEPSERVVRRALFGSPPAAARAAEPGEKPEEIVVKRRLFDKQRGVASGRTAAQVSPAQPRPTTKSAREAAYAHVPTAGRKRRPNDPPTVDRTVNGGVVHRRPGAITRFAAPAQQQPPAAAPVQSIPTGRHIVAQETGIQLVLPDDRLGERAILLPVGVAYAVLRAAEHRVPVLPQFRPVVIRALQNASTAAIGGGRGEVAIVLREDQIALVQRLLHRGGAINAPSQEDLAELAAALRISIEPPPQVDGDVVEGESVAG